MFLILDLEKVHLEKSLAFAISGIYNVFTSEVSGEYTWYKIGEDMWIAYSSEWSNLYIPEEYMEDVIVSETETNTDGLKDAKTNSGLKSSLFEKVKIFFEVILNLIKFIFKK